MTTLVVEGRGERRGGGNSGCSVAAGLLDLARLGSQSLGELGGLGAPVPKLAGVACQVVELGLAVRAIHQLVTSVPDAGQAVVETRRTLGEAFAQLAQERRGPVVLGYGGPVG